MSKSHKGNLEGVKSDKLQKENYIHTHTHTIMCTQILAMTEETLRMVILERLQTIRTPELKETNRWSEINLSPNVSKSFPLLSLTVPDSA